MVSVLQYVRNGRFIIIIIITIIKINLSRSFRGGRQKLLLLPAASALEGRRSSVRCCMMSGPAVAGRGVSQYTVLDIVPFTSSWLASLSIRTRQLNCSATWPTFSSCMLHTPYSTPWASCSHTIQHSGIHSLANTSCLDEEITQSTTSDHQMRERPKTCSEGNTKLDWIKGKSFAAIS